MILLDTNAVIAVLNDRPLVVREKLKAVLESGERVVISTLVVFELRYGAERSAHPDRNHSRIDDFLAGPLEVLPFTSDDAAAAGTIRAYLAGKGTPIGPFDVLIAGQARARGLPIVTANTGEFERVPGLDVRNWTAP